MKILAELSLENSNKEMETTWKNNSMEMSKSTGVHIHNRMIIETENNDCRSDVEYTNVYRNVRWKNTIQSTASAGYMCWFLAQLLCPFPCSDNTGHWPSQVSLAANFQPNSINAVMAGHWGVGGRRSPSLPFLCCCGSSISMIAALPHEHNPMIPSSAGWPWPLHVVTLPPALFSPA